MLPNGPFLGRLDMRNSRSWSSRLRGLLLFLEDVREKTAGTAERSDKTFREVSCEENFGIDFRTIKKS